MNIFGVVAEFNPFHNGHKYLLDQCKKSGASHVVVVMSGNFVQRGELAMIDKWARTKFALLNGADLVLELPVVWSLASAETFAKGAVSILDSLGCVDTLCFGSESGDLKGIKEIAGVCVKPEFDEVIKEYINTNVSYPTARTKAIAKMCGEEKAQLIKKSNDILCVEYVKALNELKSNIKPLAIKRTGPDHDSVDLKGDFASASQIRNQMQGASYSCFDYMPNNVRNEIGELMGSGEAPVFIKIIEKSILSRLRTLTLEEIKVAPDVSEGLENRIYKAIQNSISLEELYDNIKTKRYTHSRIRRMIMNLYLNIKAADSKKTPPYIRVLGMNDKGREVLKLAKKTATIPIITKAAHIKQIDDEYVQRIFKYECSSTDLFTLAMPNPLPCGAELTKNVVKI